MYGCFFFRSHHSLLLFFSYYSIYLSRERKKRKKQIEEDDEEEREIQAKINFGLFFYHSSINDTPYRGNVTDTFFLREVKVRRFNSIYTFLLIIKTVVVVFFSMYESPFLIC